MRRRHFLALAGFSALSGCGSEGGGADGGDGNGGGGDEADVTPSDTPTSTVPSPGTAWTAPPETETAEPEPAEFELVGYPVPETVEIGDEFTFVVKLQNTGGQAGTYSEPLYVRRGDSEWQAVGEWDFGEIDPGETITLESNGPFTIYYLGRYEYRLGQFSKTAVIQAVSATVGWENEYTTPAGYRIRVDTPQLQATYEYEDYQGDIVEQEADDGNQWAFVTVWVKNETGQAAFSPLAQEFALLYGNKQADGNPYLTNDPINKGDPFDGGELQPNVERSGWIAFQIPAELSVDDLMMAWSQDTYNGQISVRWGSEK